MRGERRPDEWSGQCVSYLTPSNDAKFSLLNKVMLFIRSSIGSESGEMLLSEMKKMRGKMSEEEKPSGRF